MSKGIRIYLCDVIINTVAQSVVLFMGYIFLIISDVAIIGWILLLIGYSFLLAKMEQNSEKKSAVFKHYIIGVMFPPNLIALAVSVRLFVVGASSPALSKNTTVGILVLAGSVTITLLSVFISKACHIKT